MWEPSFDKDLSLTFVEVWQWIRISQKPSVTLPRITFKPCCIYVFYFQIHQLINWSLIKKQKITWAKDSCLTWFSVWRSLGWSPWMFWWPWWWSWLRSWLRLFFHRWQFINITLILSFCFQWIGSWSVQIKSFRLLFVGLFICSFIWSQWAFPKIPFFCRLLHPNRTWHRQYIRKWKKQNENKSKDQSKLDFLFISVTLHQVGSNYKAHNNQVMPSY